MKHKSKYMKVYKTMTRFPYNYRLLSVPSLILLSFILLNGCQSTNPEIEKSFGMRTITRFEISPDHNPENIYVGHIGIINENEKTITINVPKQANLTEIRPTIEVAPFASVSPSSFEPTDLTDTVEYVVTAQNGKKSYYTVVCKNDYLYTNATLMAVNISYQSVENTVTERILIPSNNKSISLTLPATADLSRITLAFEPDPYSHFAQYYIGSKKTDFTEPFDFTNYPNGMQVTVISENNKNFALYTIKLMLE